MNLREMLDRYEGLMSDMQIIQEFFIKNNLEYEALSFIPKLAESKANKIQRQLDYARTWIPVTMTPKTFDHKSFDKDTEANLIGIIQRSILGLDLPDCLLEWAKENIPEIKTPYVFFLPAIEWLEKKYGIKFKENRDEREID